MKNYVAIKVSNIPTHAMVDTGADISCARPEVLVKYHLQSRCQIHQTDVPFIRTASDEKVQVQGIIFVKAEVAKEKVNIKFYLVPGLHTDFILGVDWLEAHSVCIKFGSGTLSLDPRRQLAARCETTIPPQSEKIVVARIRGKSLPAGVVGTTSPTPLIHSIGLASARVLDCVREDGTVYQRVVNPSELPVVISKGSLVGKFVCASAQDRLIPFGQCSAECGEVTDPHLPMPDGSEVTDQSQLATVITDPLPVSDDSSRGLAQSVVSDETTPESSDSSTDYVPSRDLDFSEAELTTEQQTQLCQLVDEFQDVFMGPDGKLGKCDIIQHKIEVDPNQRPLKHRAYRLAPQQKETLENILQDLEVQGVIEPSTSPWAAPCFLVAPKNNHRGRFVVDYRSLNKATVLDAHPLPTPAEALESLGASKPVLFTTLDLAQGFYQLVIDPKSRPYTAFRSHLGLYQFRRLPMGLKNSPSTFQRAMEAVMRNLTWKIAMCYLDDIVVFSSSFERHLDDLRQVFDRLKQANLRLKPSKCHFAKTRISYLGHTVSAEGIAVDPSKVEAVMSYPTPHDLKSLRSYLGLTGYFRRFIKSYATTARCLYDLTKAGVPFVWSDACESAFQQLKQSLVQAPVLAYPDFAKPFIVHTDASGFSVGAVLLQEQPDKTVRPIAYAGRSLNKAEAQYGITEKECLALIYSIKQFDCYLRYTHFTAVVDHAALQWLLNLKQPSGRLARWISLIQAYSFTIQYRPGRVHNDADGLSRRQYANTTDPHTQEGPNDTESQEDHVTAINTDVAATQPNTDTCPNRSQSSATETLREAARDLQAEDRPGDLSILAFREQQARDPQYRDLLDYLTSGALPQDVAKKHEILAIQSQYFVNDGILFHVWTKEGKGHRATRTQVQLVVPQPLVQKVLELHHDSPLFGGHFGLHRTLERTRLRYYWPSINKDVIHWVKSCIPCNQKKAPPKKTKAKVVPMPVATEPFERVSTDILGPFVASKSGNRYVLVFVDYLTKYMELVPLPNVKSQTVATAFIERVICRHGVPRVLHSDRGTQFLSALTLSVCKLLTVTKTNTTSWHPQCNGQSERMMSTIAHALSKQLEDDHGEWDRYIPQVQFCYNTSPCIDSTEYTPFFLVHGRHPRTIIDAPLAEFDVPTSAADYIVPLLEDIEVARGVAIETLKERKAAMQEKAEAKANQINFQLGDTVYLYRPVVTPGHNRKLMRPWLGPFYVSQKLSDIHVRLRRVCDGKLIANRVHIDRLKHGVLRGDGPDDPTPPARHEAIEPAVLADSEVPPNSYLDTPAPDGEAESVVVPDPPQAMKETAAPAASQQQLYDIEKVLRKKYDRDTMSWRYRVKWLGFENSENSWVDFADLTPKCKDFVRDMHSRIPTDRKSHRKR